MQIHNNGSHLGGAIYSKHSYIDVLNSIFDDNNAEDGGALYSESSSFNFINNTMINNTAYRGGSAFISVDSDFNALNSILYYNQASLGEQVFIDNVSFGFIPDFPDDLEVYDLNTAILKEESAISCLLTAHNLVVLSIPLPVRRIAHRRANSGGLRIETVAFIIILTKDPLLDMDYSISFLSPCLDAGCNEG